MEPIIVLGRRMKRTKRGFSLIEMMIVVSIIGILTAIAVPRFAQINLKSRESALRTDLQIYRGSVYTFFSDTGLYPLSLNDLASNIPPTQGVTPTGAIRTITADNWRGPYVAQVRVDPVSDKPINYSIASGSVGSVSSSATGNDTNGDPYSGY